jgi:Protein of unknown function (DUF1479)
MRRCRLARAIAWLVSSGSSTINGSAIATQCDGSSPAVIPCIRIGFVAVPRERTRQGLGAHIDAETLDLWMTSAYQQAFGHLFDGTVEQYDPWDASHRTAGPHYPETTMCSAFRTFQGWTALSDMAHDQGVLHTVPIADAMGYLMLRPLLSDVPDGNMCDVMINQVFPVKERWHGLPLEALTALSLTSRPETPSGGTAT